MHWGTEVAEATISLVARAIRVARFLRDGRQLEKMESEIVSEWIESSDGKLVLVLVKRGMVQLVGKDGSGKSSPKRSLKWEMFNSELLSTEAIEIELLHQGDAWTNQ